MKNALGLILSSASLLGILLFSNYVNDVDASFSSSLILVGMYEIFLALLGVISYFIFGPVDVVTKAEAEEPEKIVLEEEDGFEITDISFDHAKEIGSYQGKAIYDTAKVKFKNGYEALYTFADTIKFKSAEEINPSDLTPGSLIVSPGIVYVPNK